MLQSSAPYPAVLLSAFPAQPSHRPTLLTRRLHVDFARCSAMRCPGTGVALMRRGTSAPRS